MEFRRGIRRNRREYVLERFKDEDPESYFKYKEQSFESSHGLTLQQLEFLEAIKHHGVNVVKSFLDQGIDPTFTILPKRNTLLHIAVQGFVEGTASEKIIRLLLFFGSDPNTQDNDGCTPLHIACKNNSSSCVLLLLEAGAHPNVTNWNQETPVMALCSLREPSLEIVKLLFHHSADLTVTNKDKQHVVHLVCSSSLCRSCDFVEKANMVTFLLECGIPSDTVDSHGKTPLCYEILRLVYFFHALETHVDDIPILYPNAIKVALALVAGGGLANVELHKKELTTLIKCMFLIRQTRPILRSFFLSIRNAICLSDFYTICDWIKNPGYSCFRNYGQPLDDLHAEDHAYIAAISDTDAAARVAADAFSAHIAAEAEIVSRFAFGGGDVVITAASNGGADSGNSHNEFRRNETQNQNTNINNQLVTVNTTSQSNDGDVLCVCPPRLLTFSKVMIRQRLGGTLTQRVSYLGLPHKLENYIRSIE